MSFYDGGLEDTSVASCKKLIETGEGQEMDDEKKKFKTISEKCCKVEGLFEALLDEETKMHVIEDKNETYIISDESDRSLHIVKRSGNKKKKDYVPKPPNENPY